MFYTEKQLFHRQYNLLYFLGRKPDNILIYDIPKNMQLWLFKEGELYEGEIISNLIFENYYDERQKMLSYIAFDDSRVVSNYHIDKREPSENLILTTFYQEKLEERIWLIDPWGFEKRFLASISVGMNSSWQIDTFNQTIRVFDEAKNGEYFIQNFDY